MQLITVPYVPFEVVVDPKNGHALDAEGEGIMEFLVEFELEIPEEVKKSGLAPREEDLAAAAESLAEQGRLIRLWSVPSGLEDDKVLRPLPSKGPQRVGRYPRQFALSRVRQRRHN